MTFHQSPEFEDALQATADHFKIRAIFIEKDYWVTYVLKNLAQSAHTNQVVFKGGTSLSKAYNCIERFSEDIDLAIIKSEGVSGNQLTNKIKAVEKAVTVGLDYFQHPKEEKKGRNRRTFYQYPKVLEDADFGEVKDHIQLEINTFTNPVPYQEIAISSYVGQFLQQGGFSAQVGQFHLEPFTINVLSRERTFFEKLLSLIRLSYEGPDKMREKIRHFYDLHKLLGQQDLDLLNVANFSIIDLVKADDNSNDIFKGEWIDKPFATSPLFNDVEKTWKEIETAYKKDLADLAWSPLPESKEILSSLFGIREFIVEYDKAKK